VRKPSSEWLLKMASAQVVEMSVTNNSPSQDSNHPDDFFQSRYKTFCLHLLRDDICRQEFLYAKKTARKPVIPIVVGSGSFKWTMTVVGLLIAGEIYIHFQSKEVEHAKMSELLSAIKKSVPELKVPDEMENIQGSDFLTMHFGVYLSNKSDSCTDQ